jgi:zinc-ribbon domain
MYCAYCGTQVQPGQSFCTRCGHAVSGSPAAGSIPVQPGAAPEAPVASAAPSLASPVPPQRTAPSVYVGSPMESRLVRNLRLLGILWMVGSALRMIPAIGMLFFGRLGFLFMPWRARLLVAPIVGGIGGLFTVASVAGIAAGWGLLERRPWARMLAVVLGCLALVDFPFGTALGIYTLWVLLSAGAEVEYERLSRS